jgi:hypothetical protein
MDSVEFKMPVGAQKPRKTQHEQNSADVNITGREYRAFGEDIKVLTNNLDLISQIVQRAQANAGSTRRASEVDPAIDAAILLLSGYRETLDDCSRLLDNHEYFNKTRDGVVTRIASNLVWNCHISQKVESLRQRIAFHNVKVKGAIIPTIVELTQLTRSSCLPL